MEIFFFSFADYDYFIQRQQYGASDQEFYSSASGKLPVHCRDQIAVGYIYIVLQVVLITNGQMFAVFCYTPLTVSEII